MAFSPRSTASPPFSIFPTRSCDATTTVGAVPMWLLADSEAAHDVRSCARVHSRRLRNLDTCRSQHEHDHARNNLNKARTNRGVLRNQDARTDAHTHSRTHPRTHTRMHARSLARADATDMHSSIRAHRALARCIYTGRRANTHWQARPPRNRATIRPGTLARSQ